MSRHTQAKHDAASQASGNQSVYRLIAKGYNTVRWQDGAVCCGLVFHWLLTACIHTLRHASGVI